MQMKRGIYEKIFLAKGKYQENFIGNRKTLKELKRTKISDTLGNNPARLDNRGMAETSTQKALT